MWRRILGAGIAVACGIAALPPSFRSAWATHHDPAALAPGPALRLTASPAAAAPALAEVPPAALERRSDDARPSQTPASRRQAAHDKAEALARALFLLGSRGASRPFPGMPAD